MKGIFNASKSWEKQSVFTLDNGWKATLEYNDCYGEMVARLDSPDAKTYWHCSNGDKGLPEFARDWKEIVVKSAEIWVVRPKFLKMYKL